MGEQGKSGRMRAGGGRPKRGASDAEIKREREDGERKRVGARERN